MGSSRLLFSALATKQKHYFRLFQMMVSLMYFPHQKCALFQIWFPPNCIEKMQCNRAFLCVKGKVHICMDIPMPIALHYLTARMHPVPLLSHFSEHLFSGSKRGGGGWMNYSVKREISRSRSRSLTQQTNKQKRGVLWQPQRKCVQLPHLEALLTVGMPQNNRQKEKHMQKMKSHEGLFQKETV